MIKWIHQLFSSRKTENNTAGIKPEVHEHKKNNIKSVSNKYLIVGLGNIGAEYVNTRHNIGFKIVDFLAKKEGVSFETVKLGTLAQYKFKGRTFLLLKPNTYMNLSGKAVHYWMEKEKIPLENVLIIADDLNLSFGSIRIRPKGSDGGHNGIKSIILEDHSHSPLFWFQIITKLSIDPKFTICNLFKTCDQSECS